MADLIGRLRAFEGSDELGNGDFSLLTEAATEIGALRAEVERLRADRGSQEQQTAHPAITHCENCGCDWLDNGLNPIGCPYCKQSTEIERLWVELENWKESFCQAESRAERLAEALRELVGVFSESGMYDDEVFAKARAELDQENNSRVTLP